MMKGWFSSFFLSLSLVLFAETKSIEEKPVDIAKLSESLGYLIGENITSLGLTIDINEVIKGLQKASEGKSTTLTKEECLQALSKYQERLIQDREKSNLKAAESFLNDNKKNSTVMSLEEGKLQYKILKEGKGADVQPYHHPLLKYKGKYLDGTVFEETEEAIILALEETMPGFRIGVQKMKEGEIREIYIHPDLGYGKNDPISPNALLIFEIEVIRADKDSDITHQISQSKEAVR